MSKWHVSDECIYDEDDNQIIETSEWYMRENLQVICNEHNLNESLKKNINKFFDRLLDKFDKEIEKDGYGRLVATKEDMMQAKNLFNSCFNKSNGGIYNE